MLHLLGRTFSAKKVNLSKPWLWLQSCFGPRCEAGMAVSRKAGKAAIHQKDKSVRGTKSCFEEFYFCTIPKLTLSQTDGMARRQRAQPSQVRFSASLDFFKFDVAEIYRQRYCLERMDSAKSLIIDQTHLALVTSKQVLQKNRWHGTDFYFLYYRNCLRTQIL